MQSFPQNTYRPKIIKDLTIHDFQVERRREGETKEICGSLEYELNETRERILWSLEHDASRTNVVYHPQRDTWTEDIGHAYLHELSMYIMGQVRIIPGLYPY